MKILITGGLGHIGSFFLENINKIKKIKKIIIIDDLKRNKINSIFNITKKNKKYKFFNIDLSKKRSLNKIEKTDVLLNLASTTDAEGSLKIRKEIYKNNLGIFKNVIGYCKKNNTKLIHISSTSVYGIQTDIVDENCQKLKPQTPYAEIKLKEEKILRKEKKLKYITLRFGTIAGVSSGMRFHTAVNKFCLNCALDYHIPVWTKALNQYRPYLSLTDAFNSIKFIIDKNLFNKEIYNVLTNNYTVKNILNFIKCYKKVKVKYVKSKITNQLSYLVQDKKIKSLGFKSESYLKKDIKKTLLVLRNL